tara:strand:+ start:346 stop:483 length:138 start_codon:yes stop_codon:yes gene_type:complete
MNLLIECVHLEKNKHPKNMIPFNIIIGKIFDQFPSSSYNNRRSSK